MIIILLIFNFILSQELYPEEREALNELISINNLIQPYSNLPITLEHSFLLQFIPQDGASIQTIELEENCPTINCRIIGINFSDFNIINIPESFENLIMLESLNLSYNSINELPESLYSLNELRFLNLSHNNFEELPLNVGNFNSLEYLNLSSNQITGFIPDEICNLGEINLYLGNNQICPPYPECLMEDEIEYQEVSNCPEHQIGDVNQDSEINVSDIIIIVEFILGTEPTEEQFALADWTEDGEINVADAVQMVHFILNQ